MLTAMDASTNKITWQVENDYTTGHGNGFLTTAGGIAFHGNSDGFFQAYDTRKVPNAAPASEPGTVHP
jgi:glucose dehydrogenase